MPQRPPSPDADKVSADSPSIGDAVAALIDVCCTDFTTAHQPAAARLSSVESVEWSGRETSVIQLLPAFLLFSPLPFPPSLAGDCLPPSSGEQCGKASLVPVYIADPPRHLSPTFSICAPGLLLASISASAEEEISNQTTTFFCAPQKSSPSFRLVRANDVLFVLAIPFALSLRIIMRKTEVNSECTASFCLWDRPHFLLLTQF